MTHTESAVAEWRGRTAVDSDGDKIGSIEEIYMDADTGKPEWLAVKTGMFGSKVSFVPITEASDADGDVRLPYDKQQVKDAPNAEADGELSQDEEASALPPLRARLLGGAFGLRAAAGPGPRAGRP